MDVPAPRAATAPPREPTWWDNVRPLVGPVAVVLVLAALAVWGANSFSTYKAQRAIDARMGPRPNVVALPEMSTRIADGRQLDIAVQVELEPGDKTDNVPLGIDRIHDRLVDQLNGIDAGKLDGAHGANLVKSAVETAVRKEVEGVKVKGVYIDKLLGH
jgi:hypothetical protein